MRFPTAQAPYLAPVNSVNRIMLEVLVALIPGLAALVWQFGPGVLVQCMIALLAAQLGEAAMLSLRRRPIAPALRDYSAALTAVLLAVSLPPLAPWWLTAFGALFAIVIGKHLYGGLGYNPFNPAMVGYAVLLISFPQHMTAWLPPKELSGSALSFADAWNAIFTRTLPSDMTFDALTMATPLDTIKTQLGLNRLLDEIQAGGLFAGIGGRGWQWVNFGFLLGGLWMLKRGIIGWQIPVGFLGALFGISLIFFLIDPAVYPTPLFQCFSGAAMLGAFFIATDPVTASTTPRGRLIYGASIGLLVFVIRAWGGYPDGVAFAVLLLNLAAPTIDHYTRPRVYGHPK
ncbi:electron transport complex subunit RsxD [Methylocaldum sp. RMAD-M]|jgi:electron transport complex protein RnfD|uniref:electron transport complex subunit RsxD n=1 Tax=Methylocaldum sp. RMAD-M TaxID=2806557 RepID=UPI000A32A030|nr:electron transport complex subunit RsxD [Methylocaldum sp. RMAD-M]MBP1152737.1 electron transport complex protein RnfD [Methylocaldum sp. RMAD-M]